MKCHYSECNKDLPEYGSVYINTDGDACCSEECADKFRKQRGREMDFICTASNEQFESWMFGHFEV